MVVCCPPSPSPSALLAQKAHPADPGADVTQHNSHAVAAVNYGLILFLQQQHASALAVLEPLFDHVDILQDGTALCLCALLLEVYLDSCQLPKAVDILHYLQGLTTPAVSLPLGGGQEGPSEAAAAGGAGGGSSSSKGPGLASADRSPRKQQQQQDAGAVVAAGRVDGGSGGQDGAGSQQQGGAVVPLDQALPHMSKTKGTRMQEVCHDGGCGPLLASLLLAGAAALCARTQAAAVCSCVMVHVLLWSARVLDDALIRPHAVCRCLSLCGSKVARPQATTWLPCCTCTRRAWHWPATTTRQPRKRLVAGSSTGS